MGVMQCCRIGCNNVCCDLYSDKYGYICSICYSELINKGHNTNIEEFMNTQKDTDLSEDYQELWEKELKLIFK